MGRNDIHLFGDSIARGIVLGKDGRYSPIRECFGTLASERFGLHLVNKAQFGCTITKGREIVRKFLARRKESGPAPTANPDANIAILEFGGNDCDFKWENIAADPAGDHLPFTPMEDFTRLYSDTIGELKEEGFMPVLLTLPPLDARRYFEWFTRKGLDRDAIMSWLKDVQFIYRWHEQYCDLVWNVALENTCRVIDIRAKFLACHNYSDYICEDGIHPNAVGHRLIDACITDYALQRNFAT